MSCSEERRVSKKKNGEKISDKFDGPFLVILFYLFYLFILFICVR
jgi:hypothetical protein